MTARKNRPGKNKQAAKDRVLQARIPEHLDEELRSRAEQLGLSVSTIVRNVLLNTFDLVEGVVTDSSHLARALAGRDTTTSSAAPEQAVIGWQEAVLNRNGVCEHCNDILPAGERAAIGVPAGPRATLLCLQCLEGLSATTDANTGATESARQGSTPGRKHTPADTGAGS